MDSLHGADTLIPMVNRQEILGHVGRLLDSEQFVGSRSVAKLLTYCVDAALAGNEESLKETTIGIFCFGRSPGYDTKQDPIVRVTARRLRTKLDLFYEKEGEQHEFRILLPKGTYVPRFNRCANQPTLVEPPLSDNPVVPDHAPVVKAASLSREMVPVKAPLALVSGNSWLQRAIWSFLVFLLVASCDVFLTHTGLLENAKFVTTQEHPLHIGLLPADSVGMASSVPGKAHERFREDRAVSNREDTGSVEPRL